MHTSINNRKSFLASLFVCIFPLCIYATCSDESTSGIQATDPTKTDPAKLPELEIHSTTSATPELPSAKLTEKHAGWSNADCISCHPSVDHGGKSSASCTVCHGGNGAKPMTVNPGHSSNPSSCKTCHSSVHRGINFNDPMDCTTCHKFSGNQTCPVSYDTDVVVIGAGGGGLSAAALLARSGKKVVVLEKHNRVGGYMTNFRRKGYRFEISLHGFDGLDPNGMNVEMFKALDIWEQVQPVKSEIMYRSVYSDLTFDVHQDRDKYIADLKNQFPENADGIDKVLKAAMFLDKFIDAWSSYEAGSSDNMPPLEDVNKFRDYGKLPLSEFLAKHFTNPTLIALFTQLAGFAGNEPEKLSTAYFLVMWNSYHQRGYYNFIGGSESVTQAMAQVIRENKGIIRLGTLATKVHIENGKATIVETENDVCYRAKYVVSNTNTPALIKNLIGTEHIAKKDLERYHSWLAGLSAFVVFLGVDHDYSEVFGDTHEIMVNETVNPHEAFKTVYDCNIKKTPYAIGNFTKFDPTCSPKGKNTIVLTSQLDYGCNNTWQWGDSFEKYKAYKDKLGSILVARAMKFLPDLNKHIEVFEVGTPMTMSQFTLNPKGSIFGWDNIIEQSLMNRMMTKKLEGIDNLYIVGAWGFPGGGQSAVMMSGMVAAKEILASEKK